jgi:vacuolar-type H+-ATPase subunit E/Vma4
MEEIAASDSIQKEILDDARKKSEYLLRQADADSARIAAEGEERARLSAAEIARAAEERIKRDREELLARIPLEKARMMTELADRRLRASLDAYMRGFDEIRIAALAEGFLRSAASQLAGKKVVLRYRGISADLAEKTFAKGVQAAGDVSLVEDTALPVAGMIAETTDGNLVVRATMDLVEDELADRHRGELAEALFGKV